MNSKVKVAMICHFLQGPLLFDQIPDRRLTYGGLGSSPLTPQRRDRSLPTHLTLDQVSQIKLIRMN